MVMNLWGVSPLCENLKVFIVIMDTNKSTSRRQGRLRQEGLEGSRSAVTAGRECLDEGRAALPGLSEEVRPACRHKLLWDIDGLKPYMPCRPGERPDRYHNMQGMIADPCQDMGRILMVPFAIILDM